MRKKDREINNLDEIVKIMKKCDSCSIAFFDEEYPYIIPLNFGFTYDGAGIDLYFHGAGEGKKIELLKKNSKVGFEMSCSHQLFTNEDASYCTMTFESVCGNGTMEILAEDSKLFALAEIMKQYSDKNSFQFSEQAVKAVTILKLKVNQITGKRKES